VVAVASVEPQPGVEAIENKDTTPANAQSKLAKLIVLQLFPKIPRLREGASN